MQDAHFHPSRCPACLSYVAKLNRWNIYWMECGSPFRFRIGEYMPFYKRVYGPVETAWMQYKITIPSHERWACRACGGEWYSPKQAQGYAVAHERALHELRAMAT